MLLDLKFGEFMAHYLCISYSSAACYTRKTEGLGLTKLTRTVPVVPRQNFYDLGSENDQFIDAFLSPE